MTTVSRRSRQFKQPRGGFINPRDMTVHQLVDGHPTPLDQKTENLQASLVGTTVDYLTRLAGGADPRYAFHYSLVGAEFLGAQEFKRATADVKSLIPGHVDAATVAVACRLSHYEAAFRAGPHAYNPDAQTVPNTVTVDHILIMVDRCRVFFDQYGPVTLDGFEFRGAYTEVITNGDGDFLTADGLWDIKVSTRGPTSKHTLQLLIYYLMGRRSGIPGFDSIRLLGIFNPRSNAAYHISLADIPDDVVAEVSRSVIGYE